MRTIRIQTLTVMVAAAVALPMSPTSPTSPAAAQAGDAETCDGKQETSGTEFRNGTYHGTNGDDVIVVFGSATINGHRGNDTICREEDSEAFGQGKLFGGRGHDALYSNWGHDTLVGGRGRDYLYGGRDNDTFVGGPGRDILDGECVNCGFEARHNDSADFFDVGSVRVNLIKGTAKSDRGSDVVIDIDTINTGPGDDVVRGNGRHNRFHGGKGKDRLFGYGSDDTLLGGKGRDFANGGNGNDKCKAERVKRC